MLFLSIINTVTDIVRRFQLFFDKLCQMIFTKENTSLWSSINRKDS